MRSVWKRSSRHGVDVIVVDTAHGHLAGCARPRAVGEEALSAVQVIGGNIATAAGAQRVIDHRCDG
jgi:IMP dehydrogenase